MGLAAVGLLVTHGCVYRIPSVRGLSQPAMVTKNVLKRGIYIKEKKTYDSINLWSMNSMKARLLVEGGEDVGKNCSTVRS